MADYHSRYAPDALAQELTRRAAEAPIMMDDRIEHLKTCLDAMEGPARKAIDLRYAAGLPLDEIADRIGRTSGATRKYLCVLRKKLRECVEHKLAVQEG